MLTVELDLDKNLLAESLSFWLGLATVESDSSNNLSKS
ncbi:Uncharacterised protein [Mycoplasmoides gallisepticum]|uniref:Uncharacterized protein n=1 Tax=Mycoplasmoides gallisepticum TaxID=2096 RepID=A0A3B0PLG5_MYCGL|nr:Uncharacterised protein [Mycoplasmoides gallisepticum]